VSSGDSEDEIWTIRTWDLQHGQLDGELFVETHYLAGISSFASSADTNYFICMDNMNAVQRFDLKTRLPVKRDVEGDTNEIVSLLASPFQSRVAAASLNGTVWLWHWDANCLRLASPPMESPIAGFTSLRFSRDGGTLTLTSVDGDMCRWDAMNGELIGSSGLSPRVDNRTTPMLFNMKQGWSCHELGKAELQWFPSHTADLGWWAYVDGKVIRNNGGTSVTVVDLADISRDH
jgi:WD40 repeat protein